MLSRAESANVEFSQVVQLFAPSANPANAPCAEYSFYKFRKKIVGCEQCAHKYCGLVELWLGLVLGSV